MYVVVLTEWRLLNLDNTPTTCTYSTDGYFKQVVLASEVFYKPAYMLDGRVGTILRPDFWRQLL